MMARVLYRCLLWLHPAPFRLRFQEEMLWIFDEAVDSCGAAPLIADVCASLLRQWLFRSDLWKWAVASIAGTVPVIIAFGSFIPWDSVWRALRLVF